ncbi:MAG: sorbose reductase [Gammaproteobacteria bacterium CG22_combo_CG10-13_8_21_14_all_40_8]|nr:MAG: sorbose reductase [Gammaproteobacteria bacterium CG22_combo_CG10-13_8_21_14_all_40_8]
MNETHELPINLVGLVVSTTPQNQQKLRTALDQFEGAEIHYMDNGKCVLTVEQLNPKTRLADVITDINNIPGVLSTAIAYHHFDNYLTNQEQPL